MCNSDKKYYKHFEEQILFSIISAKAQPMKSLRQISRNTIKNDDDDDDEKNNIDSNNNSNNFVYSWTKWIDYSKQIQNMK